MLIDRGYINSTLVDEVSGGNRRSGTAASETTARARAPGWIGLASYSSKPAAIARSRSSARVGRHSRDRHLVPEWLITAYFSLAARDVGQHEVSDDFRQHIDGGSRGVLNHGRR